MIDLRILLLLPFLLLLSCKGKDPAPSETENAVSYLALGDSYTIGESVAEAERFPVILANELEEAGVEVMGPKIIAQTGWTTGDLLAAIEAAELAGQEFDLVSLLIGVNNQYQGRSLEEYEAEFRLLLNKSIELAGGEKENVFVVSIPDYGYTPFGEARQETISEQIDSFNTINKEIAAEEGIRYFNITPISRQGLEQPALVADDGLHPSGAMYQLWIDLILDEVLMMVQEP
ncbi:SGNH/GDSL hydrolase family protein [Nafulsella turpanensis]|uniref:SGNH/GDSL hydrolase family protein n=1 Tax=Nafulsella turpanensis TaxID=1265690 RepID=UPI00034D571F|nr:SGNH/GDSL hydrolase family protein [Nafulsella turpanensis]